MFPVHLTYDELFKGKKKTKNGGKWHSLFMTKTWKYTHCVFHGRGYRGWSKFNNMYRFIDLLRASLLAHVYGGRYWLSRLVETVLGWHVCGRFVAGWKRHSADRHVRNQSTAGKDSNWSSSIGWWNCSRVLCAMSAYSMSTGVPGWTNLRPVGKTTDLRSAGFYTVSSRPVWNWTFEVDINRYTRE